MADPISTEPATTARPLRADAERNRRRLVDAADAVFREHGFEAGVAQIARRAGVGPATLFRNFPTKEDLVIAVVGARLGEALAVCEVAAKVEDPAAAFEQMMFAVAEMQAGDQGFLETMHSNLIDEPALREPKQRLVETAGEILRRAQSAGAVRDDITAEDLRHLLASAVAQNCTQGAAPDLYRRYLRIVLDGLRPVAATPLEVGPPSPDQRLR